MKQLFLAAVLIAAGVFLVPVFTGGSESDLVMASYIAVPLAVFGIYGMIATKRKAENPLPGALIAGAVSGLLLWVFYVGLWPML